MIQFNNALKKAESEFAGLRIGTEKVSLADSLNRIISEDIYADTDQPLFTNSSMDGFALRYAKGINTWKILGEIRAGGYNNINIKKEGAVRVMTGSMLPLGADTVIANEYAIVNNGTVKCVNNIKLRKGLNIRYQGEDIKKGSLLIGKNSILDSGRITIAASCGKRTLKVYRKLKIGIMASGDELVDINIKPAGDKIRASNLYTLHSAVQEMNMIPVSFGIVRDNRKEIVKRLKGSLNSGIDVLLTIGGVSAGKYDLLAGIFKELGAELIFSKVNIKPGKPVVFGLFHVKGKKVPVFGLPGNPVSCYVSFILFVRNVILKRLIPDYKYETAAVLSLTLAKHDNKRHFLQGVMRNINGTNYVTPAGSSSSANISGLHSANCLIVFKEREMKMKKGKPVKCIKI